MTPSVPQWAGRSDELVVTAISSHTPAREGYLSTKPSPPPTIGVSPFIPDMLVEHLMRNKKRSALGVKYLPGDAISNMEGAAHTFVTPVVLANMHGDYAYRGRHTVLQFPLVREMQQARVVVMSAAVQLDFEYDEVMFELARVRDAPVVGEVWHDMRIMSAYEKRNASLRQAYDDKLRRHLVAHLGGRIPAAQQVDKPMSRTETVAYFDRGGSALGQFMRAANGKILSLELLFRAAIEQVVNEFSVLEAGCPQGYVYTYDPPAIFAHMADATVLNRVYASALEYVARCNPSGFKNMRVYAFNDYADDGAIPTIKRAFRAHPQVKIMRKADLFKRNGHYDTPREGKGALLVIHNNSDAFGQNIETEGSGGSLDGAIGSASSAAASLRRDHPELLAHVLPADLRLRT